MKRISMTMTVAAILLAAGATVAQPGPGPRGGCCGDGPRWSADPEVRVERLASRLDLDDEQKSAILAIHERTRERARELREELARLQNRRRGEMLAEEPSESALVDLTRQMGDLRTQLQVLRVETRWAVREELDDDQRERFATMGPRGGRRHGGCRDGDGPRHGRHHGRRARR